MKQLSIVVPCYNEAVTLPKLYQELQQQCTQLAVGIEYVLVDDGSNDTTLAVMKTLATENTAVHYLSFSRHFGKEAALYAGLQTATGDYVVVMDADLQDPPELLPQMLTKLQLGAWDCVAARRTDRRGEGKVRSFLSNGFYQVINHVSKTQFVPGVRDFRMMTRQMVDAVLALPEYTRFSKGIFSWVGYRTTYLSYPNQRRVAGKSSWNIWNLFKYAADGIFDFSQLPLDLAVWIGLASFVISLIGLLYIILRYVLVPASSVSGWASTICIIMLFGGVQLLCIGIIGKYIGKIYLQVKRRPLYLIKERH